MNPIINSLPRAGFFIASLFWGTIRKQRPLGWGIWIRSFSEMVKGSRGGFTQHLNQMKLFNAISTAAVIGSSLIAPNPAKAGCHPSLAANVIVPILRVSGDLKLATQAARDEGYLDVTEACSYRTISYIKKYAHVIH